MSITQVFRRRVAAGSANEPQSALFERLMRPRLAGMHRLAYRFTGSGPDAEDLVQDVLISLYQRCDELAEIVDLKAWLARVVYNRFIDQRRSLRRRVVTTTVGPNPIDTEECILDGLQSDAPGPDDLTDSAGRLCQLGAALNRLTEDQRIVILLHDAEGHSLEEIEAITGAPAGTVKSRLHRGRAQLRKLLDKGTFSA